MYVPMAHLVAPWLTKNKEARVVVLNDVAQRIIDSVRGQHPAYEKSWWKGRDSNPRPRHYESGGMFDVAVTFVNGLQSRRA
jgi:hypothetical protein